MADQEIDLRDYEYVPMEMYPQNGKVLLKKIGEEVYMEASASKEIKEFYKLAEPSTSAGIMNDYNKPPLRNISNTLASYDLLAEPLERSWGQVTEELPAPKDTVLELALDEVEPGDNANCPSLFRWSHECVLAFLTLYEDKQYLLHKGKISKKKFFDTISEEMKSKGFDVTGNQCKTKVESLKRQYKSIKDHNNKSGNDRRDWRYLERLDELFGKKPWIKPISTASSSETTTSEQGDIKSSSSSPTTKLINTKNRRLVDLLGKMKESKEKQHEEKMKQRGEALKILQMLVEAVSSKN